MNDYNGYGYDFDYLQGQYADVQQQVDQIAQAATATLPTGAAGQVYVADASGNPTPGNVAGDSNGVGLSVVGTTLTATLTQDLRITASPTLASLLLTGFLRFSGTPQTLTGAGAVNVTTDTTYIVTTGANALTLADGAQGQEKTITMITDGGDGTLTPTNASGFTTITFNDVGDTVKLKFLNSKWCIIGSHGVVVA